MSKTLVIMRPDRIELNVETVAEAKLAIKELKLKKKELQLERKAVVAQQQAIRAEHADSVRSRGAMMRGGGGLGKFVRGIQSIGRDSEKSQFANRLRPLDQEKERLDRILLALDELVIKTERYIVENS